MSCAMTKEEKKKEDNDLSKAKSIKDSTKKRKKRSRQKDIDLSELTPILLAAWNGITEMVEKTLRIYPMTVYDVDNKHQKNIVLLTVEHKKPCVYKLLLSLKEEKIIKESVFYELDNKGNSALHLAAKSSNFKWPVLGDLSQMQWEIKWYEVRAQNGQVKKDFYLSLIPILLYYIFKNNKITKNYL